MTQTEVLPVFLDPNAAYSTMSWTPANSDLGFHLVCANAEDTNGYCQLMQISNGTCRLFFYPHI